VWFALDFQNSDAHPMWHGLGLLFGLSFIVLIMVTLLTPAESPETLRRFYLRCRPPGFWKPVRQHAECASVEVPETGTLLMNSTLGVLACFCLVLATNAVFVSSWPVWGSSLACAVIFSAWLVLRVFKKPSTMADSLEANVTSSPESSLGAAFQSCAQK
jgi:hypothetical protein